MPFDTSMQFVQQSISKLIFHRENIPFFFFFFENEQLKGNTFIIQVGYKEFKLWKIEPKRRHALYLFSLETKKAANSIRKSLGPHNFSQLLATIVMWQSVIDKEKMVGPCLNDS